MIALTVLSKYETQSNQPDIHDHLGLHRSDQTFAPNIRTFSKMPDDEHTRQSIAIETFRLK